MPEIKTDSELIMHFVTLAQKDKYYGDIVISFRAGELTYFRKNFVRTKDEVLCEINTTKVLTKSK